jgi:Na+/phosphate symporter
MYDYYGYSIGLSLFFLGLFLIPAIFFLLTLQNTLKVISEENRKMPPANVWLMFIPLFNIVWQFIMVDRIAQSIGAECSRLNIPVKENKPTYGIGLAWNICNFLTIIPFIGGLASLVTFIIYWVKVSEFKNLIKANQNSFMLDAERNIFHGDKTI